MQLRLNGGRQVRRGGGELLLLLLLLLRGEVQRKLDEVLTLAEDIHYRVGPFGFA
jgi:hypothetical protein